MKPLDVSDTDLALIKEQLTAANKRVGKRRLQALEWGSGGSTIQFPLFLRTLPGEFEWQSIEHSLEWRNRVREELKQHGLSEVRINLFNCDGDPKKELLNDYVRFPFVLRKRFDFIFVDGRKRRRCLINAAKLLAPGGVVMLHDAERVWYHCAFDHFTKHELIGDRLWVGQVDI